MDKHLLKVSRAVKRMNDIFKVMKGLSYNVEIENLEEVSFENLVHELEIILNLGHEISIKFDLDKSIQGKKIKLNKNQFIQVMINLIHNSRDAISESKEKWIEVGFSLSQTRIIGTVTDSGKGISKDNLEKIDQPLYTTKEKGTGTGLGLPIVKHLCHANDGQLYYNLASENTCFVFDFHFSK